jgi:transposase-like protein
VFEQGLDNKIEGNKMNNKSNKRYSNEFKFKVALACLKGDKTATTLCKEFGVCEAVVHKWKNVLKEKGARVFEQNEYSNSQQELNKRVREMNECIGELALENKFLKKSLKV